MHPLRKTKRIPKFQTRTDAEWARVLDLYKIRWQYLPAPICLASAGDPVTYQFEFFLPSARIYLDTKGNVPLREPLDKSRGVLGWRAQVIAGDPDGSFHFVHMFGTKPRGYLLYCPGCRRYFFSASTYDDCGDCMGESAWVQEQSKLSWFGFPGNARVIPRNILSPPEEKEAQQREDEVAAQVAASEVPQLFNEDDAKAAKARESGDWEKLKTQLSGFPKVHLWPDENRLVDLAARYPNFEEVCQFVRTELRLARHKPDKAVRIPNILLVGSPSCGKSSFANQLAEILVGEDQTRIDLGQQATNFALVGTDSGFKKGKEGRILRAMVRRDGQGAVRNPLIIFDEMDKVVVGGQYDPLPALLSLLDKRDAKRFVDEFFTVPVDASGLNFLALANEQRGIAGPLASRFIVFTIPDYSQEQFIDIVVPNIYREWRQDFFENTFPEELSPATKRQIARAADFVARQVRPLLNQMVASGPEELWPRLTWETLGLSAPEGHDQW